ncbi:anti-sigma factor [Pelagibius sp. Alg239-R121]|uniref:anti-sigma factor family protein n=1 Tax=Pelagibius sp. Alg239-R121 TaxID=2993448 RepID=UPI0024A6D794|nr:zf-HC2 domain-containing protein [Pelagibius sp. Alg239-R121]
MMGLSKRTINRIHGILFKLPMMITCRSFEDFILAYLDDKLPPRQKFVLDTHLELCPECRDYLRACRISIELAKTSAREAEVYFPIEVPEKLIQAVLEAQKVQATSNRN